MTTTERADLAALWARIGRLLASEPVEPDPTDGPEPEPVSEPEPEPEAEATVSPIGVTEITAADDDQRYASRRQRGLIAGLTDTDYNPSGALRRNMAKAIITALLDGQTVTVPALDVTLKPNPTRVSDFKARASDQAA